MGGGRDGFPELPRAFARRIRTDPLPFLIVSLTVLLVCPSREEELARSMRAWVCVWFELGRKWRHFILRKKESAVNHMPCCNEARVSRDYQKEPLFWLHPFIRYLFLLQCVSLLLFWGEPTQTEITLGVFFRRTAWSISQKGQQQQQLAFNIQEQVLLLAAGDPVSLPKTLVLVERAWWDESYL